MTIEKGRSGMEKMAIDGNEMEKRAMDHFRAGDRKSGDALQDQFLAAFHADYDGGDHCSCSAPCKHHGNCRDCVAIHRGHRDHLPACFRSMVNERIASLSALTEHTAYSDEE